MRGTARKNHVYAHAVPEMIGLGDSRITASTMPRATPIAIASTVSSSVVRTPPSTGGANMLSSMKRHWNAGLVTSMLTNIATSTATTAVATQRPGCRTGTALITSGSDGASVRGTVTTRSG